LIVGRGTGIARAVTLAARDAGARVVVANRDPKSLTEEYKGEPGVTSDMIDLTDEESISALAKSLGTVDHVVSTASARARGRIADLDRDAVRLSFDTKVNRRHRARGALRHDEHVLDWPDTPHRWRRGADLRGKARGIDRPSKVRAGARRRVGV
jgi:NAD(P)-dependent dehydrogenase (short-subunit alcohol dehydrogenase family)